MKGCSPRTHRGRTISLSIDFSLVYLPVYRSPDVLGSTVDGTPRVLGSLFGMPQLQRPFSCFFCPLAFSAGCAAMTHFETMEEGLLHCYRRHALRCKHYQKERPQCQSWPRPSPMRTSTAEATVGGLDGTKKADTRDALDLVCFLFPSQSRRFWQRRRGRFWARDAKPVQRTGKTEWSRWD